MLRNILFCSLLLVNSGINVFSQGWKQADDQWESCMSRYRFDSALFYADEAAAIVRGSLGENSPVFARMLNKLAVSHFYLGNFLRSRYYTQLEINLREKLNTTGTGEYVQALENMTITCLRIGRFEEAFEWVKKAEKSALKLYGDKSREYANLLSAFAGVYNDLGCSTNDIVFLNKAGEYFIRAENIYKNAGTQALKSYLVNRSNQAVYANNLGNSPLAESMFLEVLSRCEQEFGRENKEYISALNNVGVCYYNNGLFKQAESFFAEAVNTCKTSGFAGTLTEAACLNNLGALYHEVGNFGSAMRLISEAGEIMQKFALDNHPTFSFLLNNLASVALSKEYYSSPELKSQVRMNSIGKQIFSADSIFSINCQMPHPDGFCIKNNLSLWYKLTGDTINSLKLIYDITQQANYSLKVLTMVNKISWQGSLPRPGLPDAHADLEPHMLSIKLGMTDHMYNEQALANNEQTQTASTRLIINMVVGRATNIKNALGPYHPGYAAMLKGLIPLYKSIGSYRTEEDMMLEYMKVISHNTLQNFSFLSDHEKEMYYQTRLPDWHWFIDYTLNRKNANPAITGSAYNQVLMNKGLMLKSSTAMRLAIQNSNDSVLLRQYDDWISLQKKISVLYATPVEMRPQDVSQLENRATALEKELVKGSQTFSDYQKGLQITWQDVRNGLKPDEAAIEFTHFRTSKKGGGYAIIYCALVLRNGSLNPEMIKLFEEPELLKITGFNEENNSAYITRLYGTRNEPDSNLYRLIWKPLEKYLAGVKRVYLSPSGLLYKISFATLCLKKDVYLCDRYEIFTCGNTGTRPGKNVFQSMEEISALVFGGIDYGTDASGLQIWNYLSGTRDEGTAVRKILQEGKIKTELLTGTQATETSLKNNSRDFNILHIATHGFFFPDPDEVAYAPTEDRDHTVTLEFRGKMRGMGTRSFVENRNPLMRSGLVFAGANDVWNKQEITQTDDGVLTAQEVTQIDMRKDYLVVLSACETGLGDIRGNEGVYGLQRAFKMAGVKYIIMSLWQVPDRETVEFMEAFYTNLLKLKEVRQAFVTTQQQMRQKYDPYFWAAFVLME